MLKRCFILLLLTLLLSTAAGWPEPEPGAKVCVFLFTNLSETERRDIFRDIVTDALTVELKVAGFGVVPQAEWQKQLREEGVREEELLRGPVAVRLAGKLKADLALTGFVRIDDGDLLVGIKCYEVASERLILSLLRRGTASLQVYSLINDSAAELVAALRNPPAALPAETVTVQRQSVVEEVSSEDRVVELGIPVQVTLLSKDEGAEIYLAGERSLGRTEGGRLSFVSKAGTRLILTARKPGRYEARIETRLKKDTKLKLPPLQPVLPLELELEYSAFQFLGLGAAYRRYLEPGWRFWRLEDYLYLQYPFTYPRATPIPHNDLELQVGSYLFIPPGSRLRFGVAAGLGFIYTLAGSPPGYADAYLNPLDAWFELNLRNWALYYKVETKYFLGLFPDLNGTGYMEIYGPTLSLGVIRRW